MPRGVKIGRMTGAEYAAFREEYPFSAKHHGTDPHGTDNERKLIHAFFGTLQSKVVTSTNRAYFSTETDLFLFNLGMWK